MIDKLDQWHKTRIGLLAFVMVELLIAYGFVSLAIDRGNIPCYILTIMFFIGALQNLFKLVNEIFWKVRRG